MMQTAIKMIDGEWYFSDEAPGFFLNKIKSAKRNNEAFVRLKFKDRNEVRYISIDKIVIMEMVYEG